MGRLRLSLSRSLKREKRHFQTENDEKQLSFAKTLRVIKITDLALRHFEPLPLRLSPPLYGFDALSQMPPALGSRPFQNAPLDKMTLTYVLVFRAAHRAFINSDKRFFAAALMGTRLPGFLGAALTFLGLDLPFHVAQRRFIAAEIRLRAAALMLRPWLAFGGRPRRGRRPRPIPSKALIARSIRVRSERSSFTKFCRSMCVLSV